MSEDEEDIARGGRFYDFRSQDKCFSCKIKSVRCNFLKSDGSRCRNKVVVSAPFCWQHTKRLFGVRVKESAHVPGEKGLFAAQDFRRNDFIIPYYGNVQASTQNDDIYGEETAPYAADLGEHEVIDAACYRGAASAANDGRVRGGRRVRANAKLSYEIGDGDSMEQIFCDDRGRCATEGQFEGDNYSRQHMSSQRQGGGGDLLYVGMYAVHPIREGEEILLNYGRNYDLDADVTSKTTGYKRANYDFCRDYVRGGRIRTNKRPGVYRYVDPTAPVINVLEPHMQENVMLDAQEMPPPPPPVDSTPLSGDDIASLFAGYFNPAASGGDISSEDLRNTLESSYSGEAPDGFDIDHSISKPTATVMRHRHTGQVVVAHRGTKEASDWANNAVYGIGGEQAYKLTHRYKDSQRVQKRAEEKYGKHNVVTVGHSQGGLLAQMLGKDSKEIVTVNKATRPQEVLTGSSKKKNQHDIRSSSDPVSMFRSPFAKKKNTTTIKSKSYFDPLGEHSYNILGRTKGKSFGRK